MLPEPPPALRAHAPPPPTWEIAATPIPPDTTDAQLVALWLHGKSAHTIRAYGDDVAAFAAFTGKSLRAMRLSDLQRYADSLVGAPATRARRLRSLKSSLRRYTRRELLHDPVLLKVFADQ